MRSVFLVLLLLSSNIALAQVSLYGPYANNDSPSVVEALHADALDDQLEFGPMVANVDDDPELETIIVVRGLVIEGDHANSEGRVYVYDHDGSEFTGSPLNISNEMFDIPTHGGDICDGLYTTNHVTVGDIDGDDINEIILLITSADGDLDYNLIPDQDCPFGHNPSNPQRCIHHISQLLIFEYSSGSIVFKNTPDYGGNFGYEDYIAIGDCIPVCFDLDQDGDQEVFLLGLYLNRYRTSTNQEHKARFLIYDFDTSGQFITDYEFDVDSYEWCGRDISAFQSCNPWLDNGHENPKGNLFPFAVGQFDSDVTDIEVFAVGLRTMVLLSVNCSSPSTVSCVYTRNPEYFYTTADQQHFICPDISVYYNDVDGEYFAATLAHYVDITEEGTDEYTFMIDLEVDDYSNRDRTEVDNSYSIDIIRNGGFSTGFDQINFDDFFVSAFLPSTNANESYTLVSVSDNRVTSGPGTPYSSDPPMVTIKPLEVDFSADDCSDLFVSYKQQTGGNLTYNYYDRTDQTTNLMASESFPFDNVDASYGDGTYAFAADMDRNGDLEFGFVYGNEGASTDELVLCVIDHFGTEVPVSPYSSEWTQFKANSHNNPVLSTAYSGNSSNTFFAEDASGNDIAVWCNEVLINGNFTIDSGDELTIQAGTIVKFEDDTQLTVTGTLNIEGEEGNPVYFICRDPDEEWCGIYNNGGTLNLEHVVFQDIKNDAAIENSVDGEVVLSHCVFNDCHEGVLFKYATNLLSPALISHCTFNDCAYGIYGGFGGGVTVDTCVFDSCGYNAIYATSGEYYVNDCTIEHSEYSAIVAKNCTMYIKEPTDRNSGEGIIIAGNADGSYVAAISVIDSEVYLSEVSIWHNYGRGIFLDGLSTVHMNDPGATPQVWGYNRISENGPNSGSASLAEILIGKYAQINIDKGYNDILDSQNPTFILMETEGASTVEGTYNYWGASGPSASLFVPTGFVNYSSYSTTPYTQSDPYDAIVEERLAEAVQMRRDEDYEGAWDTYIAILDSFSTGEKAPIALRGLADIYVDAEVSAEDAIELLASYANENMPDAIQLHAQRMLARLHAQCADFTDAYAIINTMIENESDSDELNLLTVDALWIETMEEMADPDGRGPSSREDGRYSLDNRLLIAMGALEGIEIQLEPDRTVSADELPTEFSINAYPNPFNPTTTVQITLPEAADLQVHVFDLLGRSVATVDCEALQAGTHEVVLDGSEWASGVYFVQTTAGQYHGVRKIVLVK